jgi:hypothetical protein
VITLHPLKQAAADCLSPLVRLSGALDGRWRQLWSFARLRAQIPGTDPSVVVLGMPELHGTRRIRLDIFFATLVTFFLV